MPRAAHRALVARLSRPKLADPTGYGRIVRDERGLVQAIVEQKAASAEQLKIQEINPGLYCFDAKLFWNHIGEIKPNNAAKEYYLTDMVEILARHGQPLAPLLVEDESELLGINTRVELATADKILRARKARELMLKGVTIENPESVTIDVHVSVEADSVIEANVQLRGHTRIGTGCRIGTGSVLKSCEIGDNATILPYVVAEASTIRGESLSRTIFAAAHECRCGRGLVYRQLCGVEEDETRARFEGQPFDVFGRYDGGRECEYRRWHDHL